jgi:hypothetical protein
MGQARSRLIGLCLPLVLVAALDGALTLAGQSDLYWAGHYAHVNEGSPTFRHLLAYHPVAFVLGWFGYVLVLAALILLLPQTLALTTSIAATVAYAWGASTWLWVSRRFVYGYQLCNALFLFVGVALAVGIRWGWRAEPRHDGPLGERLPGALRWAVIGVLFAVVVYMVFWPRKA